MNLSHQLVSLVLEHSFLQCYGSKITLNRKGNYYIHPFVDVIITGIDPETVASLVSIKFLCNVNKVYKILQEGDLD